MKSMLFIRDCCVSFLLTAALCTFSAGCGDKGAATAPSVPVSLSGRVMVGEHGLAEVSVCIFGATLDSVVTTAPDGAFHLDEVPPGRYTILPVRDGYRFEPPDMIIELGEAGLQLERFAACPESPRSPETVEGLVFLPIPPGSFLMGSGTGSDSERPVHRVALPAFYMSATEVTQDIYLRLAGKNPSYSGGNLRQPVEQVSWNEAVSFCNLLSDRAGRDRCYNESTGECDFTRNGYRLPTEAEWEYACRAGTVTEYYTGNTAQDLDRAGWYGGNGVGASRPAGGKEPNAWGLFDMHGNVWEWCNDRYLAMYYAASPVFDPRGPGTGPVRVIRGGGWFSNSDECRASYRGFTTPDTRHVRIGFRVVRND